MAVTTQCVASKHNSQDLSGSCENPFDWTYEELKGRATGIYLPMDRDEVLVKDGEWSKKRGAKGVSTMFQTRIWEGRK